MDTLRKPVMQRLLAQLDAFNWLMNHNPRPQRAPGAVENAHTRRAELTSLNADTVRDTGMSPEDATGISSYQPDLPFFMQSGFK